MTNLRSKPISKHQINIKKLLCMMPQEKLAECLGCSQSAISDWKLGKHAPHKMFISKIEEMVKS